jgi:hypothetical protein
MFIQNQIVITSNPCNIFNRQHLVNPLRSFP